MAFGAPVLVHAVGLAILLAAGTTNLLAKASCVGAGAVPHFAIGLVITTVLALAEEAGWCGYMLPRLTSIGVVASMLLVGFLHGLWPMPLLLTTDYYHATSNPWFVAPLFLATLTLAGVFYGFPRLSTGSIWPVAIAHASANMAWEISSRVSETKSPLVLEYIGGENGLIIIGGLVIIDLLPIRFMRARRLLGPAAVVS